MSSKAQLNDYVKNLKSEIKILKVANEAAVKTNMKLKERLKSLESDFKIKDRYVKILKSPFDLERVNLKMENPNFSKRIVIKTANLLLLMAIKLFRKDKGKLTPEIKGIITDSLKALINYYAAI